MILGSGFSQPDALCVILDGCNSYHMVNPRRLFNVKDNIQDPFLCHWSLKFSKIHKNLGSNAEGFIGQLLAIVANVWTM